MKKILTVLLTSTFLIISFSCNNGIVDPPEDQPGSREFIKVNQSFFIKMEIHHENDKSFNLHSFLVSL